MARDGITLDQVNLISADPPASRAFYARLGVAFSAEASAEWDAHHVSSLPGQGASPHLDIDLDSTTFVREWNEGWPGGSGVVLGFKVETREAVDELVAELAADRVPVQQPPWDAFWGARYAVVSDPDGNGVGIMSPVDPERRTPQPPPVPAPAPE